MRIRMIRHAALMLAMAFVTAAVHAQTKIDLNGTWLFAVETDQGSGTGTVTLKVEGEKVTGHISNATFESDLTGTLKGQALEFSFSRDVGAVTYKGTAESSDAIKGTVDIAGVTGTFTAKRKPHSAQYAEAICCATGARRGRIPGSHNADSVTPR